MSERQSFSAEEAYKAARHDLYRVESAVSVLVKDFGAMEEQDRMILRELLLKQCSLQHIAQGRLANL